MSLSGAISLGYAAAHVRFLVTFAIVVSTSYCADFTTYIGDSNQYQVAALPRTLPGTPTLPDADSSSRRWATRWPRCSSPN
jgi:hypothetical protein